ncbi:hypothetical protein [Arthrobacter sp. AL12]|uniref:hypothetical protein n=1 Tax=Arthrobacter sp. AL12 TaxID=3042241 RepID=UPI00249AFA32|nr:hypothetical protein [Arthrobacter sp. AL12]MDI3211023.1 hypothetical protein [Arthrobacter sp. AL12]
MSRPQPVLARLQALAAASALLAGCTTASPPAGTSTPQSSTSTPQATVSPVCAAADALADALTGFKEALVPGATVEQVRAARDRVVKTYNDLVTAIGGEAKGRVDAVRSAEDKFASAVNEIDNVTTLTAAADSLRAEAANVQAALSDLVTDVQC